MKCPKCDAENTQDSQFCKKCATSLTGAEDAQPLLTQTIETPREELTTGSTFAGRYQIIEELGKGGMGKVYRALDKKLNEEVALKLIKSDIASDINTIERFKNELRLARKIRQKNVGSMYELLEDNGIHFITMEYVSGQDLKGLIRQTGQLTVGKAISIAKQICDGLSEAHSLGVVHRDLKPNNIMIDRGGNAKIMDFGIARAVKGKSITGPGVMIGTPQYMSPEQVEGKDVDQRSDIYSLGIILYEMLTARVPFEGDTPLTVGVKQKTETPKDPKEFNERIPDDLSCIILKCLEKDRNGRYEDTNETYADLTKIEQGIPTTEREIAKKRKQTTKEITVSFSLRKPWLPFLFTGIAILIGLLIWSPWSREKTIFAPTDKPSLAILYFGNSTGEKSLASWRISLSDMLTADLSQSEHLYILSNDRVYGTLKRLNLLTVDSYSTQELRRLAAQSGVNHLLRGSYTLAGETFVITLFLDRIDTGKLISSFRVEGEGLGSIPSLVDEITRRVKKEMKLTPTQIASDIDKEAARITSQSPEALAFYSQARRIQWESDWGGAIRLFENAVEIDPDFAMAYRAIGISYSNSFYMDKARFYLRKSLELAERLSEREYLQIKGDLAWNSGQNEEALQAFGQLLARHPDDVLAYHNQGTVYNSMGDTEKAIESFSKSVQHHSDFPSTYWRLSDLYKSQGWEEKSREILQLYTDRFESHPAIHTASAEQYMDEGNYKLAMDEITKALVLDPGYRRGIRTKALIHFYAGDLDSAEKEYRGLLLDQDHLQDGLVLSRLTKLYVLQGRFHAAKERAQEGLEKAENLADRAWILGWRLFISYAEYTSGDYDRALDMLDADWDYTDRRFADYALYKPNSLHLRGLSYMKNGMLDEARETADELMAITEQEQTGDEFYNHLLGSIEFEAKNYTEAVALFEQSVTRRPSNILYLFSAASAYQAAGVPNDAQILFERITSITSGRNSLGTLGYNDLYAKSFYMLGKIHEEQGNAAKAIEYYERFLNLWKDADPAFPEVADARERVARLR